MADHAGARTIEDTQEGVFVPDLLDTLQSYEDDTPPTRAEFVALINTLRMAIAGFNGGISLGDGKQSSRTGNLNAQNIQITVRDTAALLAIPHGLGRKPVGYFWFPQRFPQRSGGAVPLLIPCGTDGNVAWGGGDNAVDSVPSAWDNRMVFFTAEGDSGWLTPNAQGLTALYRIVLY